MNGNILLISVTGAFAMPIGVSDSDIAAHDLVLAQQDDGDFFVYKSRSGEADIIDKRKNGGDA